MDEQISTLLQCVHATNQCMDHYRRKVANGYNTLQLNNIVLPHVMTVMDRNVTHIKQCLGDDAYQANLTTDQLQQLSACVDDAASFCLDACPPPAQAIVSEPVADVSVTPDA